MKKIFLLLFICIPIVISVCAKSYITTQDINVREGAGTNYAVLGVLKNGTNIEMTEITGSWGKINYQNKDGYITTKFLNEVSEKSNVSTEEKSKGLSTSTILIIIGFVAFIFVFRKSPIVRYFAPVMTNLVSSSNRENSSSSNYSRDNRATKSNPYFWFGCEKCGTTIESLKQPSTNGCPNDKNKWHRWNNLAPSGEINYQCEKCGTLINATKQPSTNGCPNDKNKWHRWNKL